MRNDLTERNPRAWSPYRRGTFVGAGVMASPAAHDGRRSGEPAALEMAAARVAAECAFSIDVEIDTFDVRSLGEGAFHLKFPGGRKIAL
jgi:hypothetical protein